MRSARSYGQPLAVFWGQREPGQRWTERDTLLATALQAYEDSLCGGCGQPLDESTHPDNEFGYGTDDPIRCHACTAIEQRREAVEKAKYRLPGALRIAVKRLTGRGGSPA